MYREKTDELKPLKSLHPGLVIILAALMVLPGLVYFSMRLSLPGDPSNPVVDFLLIQPGGLAVRPISPGSETLQIGDIVTAIQGKAVDQYIQGMLSPQRSTIDADRIQYSVLRGNQTLQIDAPVKAFSFLQIFKENWSIYIYLIYLEIVSLFVFIQRPRLPAAQLFFVVSNLLLASGLVFFLGMRVDDLLYRWLVVLYLWGAVGLYGIVLAALVHMSLIFPKTHPILLRHPSWRLLIYLGVWLPILLYLAARWSQVTSPAARMALVVQGTSFMSVIYFPLLLLSTYSSYRTGNEREKRQIRWIMWSLMISLIPYLIFNVLPSLLGNQVQLANSLVGILWCTVPTSFAIAVLYERLFDIDVIIRRTLIYSALTVTLIVIYVVTVLILQGFSQVLTGKGQSPLATVISTLMIATLFNPLRRRIQKDIDRRFYRRKYDAEKILKEFALQLRNEVEMEKITEDILNVVEETMEPQNLSLWISKSSLQSLAGGASDESK